MTDYPNDFEQDEWKEFQDEQKDRQEDYWEETDSQAEAYPTPKKSESQFALFKDVWKTKDSTKVANINPKTELGDLGISIRHGHNISYVAGLLHENDVKNYFANLSEITLATSMAKNGWFTELFVSTKKFTQKSNLQNLQGSAKSGWKLFGKKKETTPVAQETQS